MNIVSPNYARQSAEGVFAILKSILARELTLPLVVFAIFLVNLIIRYPGFPNLDSDLQYAQAVSHKLSDWQPPIMAWVWSYARHIVDGNGSIYALHVFFYWLGFGVIGLTLRRIGHPLAAWTVVGAGMLPPMLMMNIHILKDVGLAVTLLSSFAIVFWHRAQGRPINPAAGTAALVLLLYGGLVRSNAVFAVPPLLLYTLYPSIIYRLGRYIGSYVVLAVVAVPGAGLFNHHVLGAASDRPIRSLQIFDLAGIAFHSGEASVYGSDERIDREFISKCYSPVLYDTLAGRGVESEECRLAVGPFDSPDLAAKWLSAIARYPLAYARHRLTHFNAELGAVMPRHHPEDAQYNWTRFVDAKPATLKEKAIDIVRYSAPFRPWFSFVAGFVILGLSYRGIGGQGSGSKSSGLNMATICLAASGLVYMGAYVVVGVASEFRYQYWGVIAIWVAGVFCATERWSEFFPPSRFGKISLGVLLLALAIIQMGGYLGWYPV